MNSYNTGTVHLSKDALDTLLELLELAEEGQFKLLFKVATDPFVKFVTLLNDVRSQTIISSSVCCREAAVRMSTGAGSRQSFDGNILYVSIWSV